MLQRNAISQKLLRVAFRTVFLRSFTVFASCKPVSMTLFLVTKSSITYTVTAEFKVQSNSTCAYVCSIRNYGILIYWYAHAARTEQYSTILILNFGCFWLSVQVSASVFILRTGQIHYVYDSLVLHVCVFMNKIYAVVLQKSTHGWSILQVCQTEEWMLF